MSKPAGLAFEQAPPFSLPLRFFLTAPLFLLAAAGLILFAPESLNSRWTSQALALTHTLTLGFLAMAMIGALMQMLPVVAGATLPAARLVAWLSYVPFALGTISLVTGFLNASPAAFGIGITLLGAGFAVFLAAMAVSLVRAQAGITVAGIRFAVVCLGLTVALGLALALMRTGWWTTTLPAMSAAHVAFGLVGWVLLLVIGVAYQVVPMFQITPPYPPRLARWLASSMFTLLAVYAVTPQLPETVSKFVALLAELGLAAGILSFAVATLRLQSRRRRKLPDITLDFWRIGMASLILCIVVWLSGQFRPAWRESDIYPLLLGVLFIGGFAVSVVNGMLYKIVPFLAWFHLQAQLQARAGTIPNMKEMIAERWMRMQFRLHLAAYLLLVAATVWPHLFHILAGIALGLSALLLWLNLLAAMRRYVSHGGRLT